MGGPRLDKLRKDIIKVFKAEGLNITIETNLAATDFLDVTFDLSTGKFYPFRKPNDNPMYINAGSNHPPSILKQLPKIVNKRLSGLSFDETEFDKAKTIYENALSSSGFDSNLTYENNQQNHRRRTRSRKIIWFNPPYSQQVKTNIGKLFLKLVRKHFPMQHHFRKIFNTNTIKISYCCTANMGSIIKQHNDRVLNRVTGNETRPCNCRDKPNCPMDGQCLSKCIVYKAVVEANNTNSTYYGVCEGEFKSRYNNHTKSFRLRKYENDTELSKCIWSLKDNNTEYAIKWSIVSKAIPYKCGSRRCDLCLAEKVAIVRSEPKGLLNKRTELISKCRHRNKYVIGNVK